MSAAGGRGGGKDEPPFPAHLWRKMLCRAVILLATETGHERQAAEPTDAVVTSLADEEERPLRKDTQTALHSKGLY